VLELNQLAWSQVQARYARIGRTMSPTNRKQALLPRGCEVIENENGTAPGFAIRVAGTRLYFLPGVPREMKQMVDAWVLADVRDHFSAAAPLRHTFRVMGRGESQLQEQLGSLSQRFPGIALGFRTKMPENQVKLTAAPGEPRWEEAKAWVRGELGENCFTENPDEELAATVGGLLRSRGDKVAVAESCTGGWVSHLIVSEAGSSRWFERGWVTYSNTAKTEELGVPADLIEQHGAVSEEVARAMASGSASRAGVQWGVGITGVAGPTGGTPEKPVGTVWIAVAGPGGVHARKLTLGRDRTSNRRFSAWLALEMLRRQLLRASRDGAAGARS
jgi:nicotinamide-nucleotide amidase